MVGKSGKLNNIGDKGHGDKGGRGLVLVAVATYPKTESRDLDNEEGGT